MSAEFPIGTRVRMTRSTWPQRRDCLATVVDVPKRGVYPDPVGPGNVLLLIDDDPLANYAFRKDHGWSCVERAENVDRAGV